ncbi:NADH:ubiquinone oxidoreductase [Basidiobolus ranarum]|uniref:NADH:ubiquinone oxidoreductase n=1 Tax=Basidiobolus ranarum TaxID=34480 RepID=A0ABR2WMK9_9FUNG
MTSELPQFSSTEDEIKYWKDKALNLELKLAETRESLEDFQESSRELEEELEKELNSSELTNKELNHKYQTLKLELGSLRQKYQESKLDANHTITTMQKEIDTLRQAYELYKKRNRELEQNNDDLETYGRRAQTSIEDLEEHLNKAVEWKIKLEHETEVKNRLMEEVQRLKDELKELQTELEIVRSRGGSLPPPSPTLSRVPFPQLSKKHSLLNVLPEPHKPNNPLAMVQEIMERVKTLEGRLASSRSLITPLLTPSRSNSPIQPTTPTTPTKPDLSAALNAKLPFMSPPSKLGNRARSLRADKTRRFSNIM